ncbi:hypothetical protein GCM10020358_30460 [Amorphoplanes nipponensis]|uniref:Uncharacterized protein n=1 Tax=Actinoplanes nipponensis TaxID=135950 RepID=A0A919J925_9ACTN|nr:hypothetical protein Ani05nite_01830 [Actinoplanes nipponensis]
MGQHVPDGPARQGGRLEHRAVVQPLRGTDQPFGGLINVGHEHKRVDCHDRLHRAKRGPGGHDEDKGVTVKTLAPEFAFVAVVPSVPSVQTRQTIAEGVGIVLFVVRAFRFLPEAAA